MGLTTFSNGFACFGGKIHISLQPRFKEWVRENYTRTGEDEKWDLMCKNWIIHQNNLDLPEEDMSVEEYNRMAFNQHWDDTDSNEFWFITGDTTGRMKILLTCVFGVPIYFDEVDEIFDLDMALPVDDDDYYEDHRRPYYAYVDKNSMDHIMDTIRRMESGDEDEDVREKWNEYLLRAYENDDTIRNNMSVMTIRDTSKMRVNRWVDRLRGRDTPVRNVVPPRRA